MQQHKELKRIRHETGELIQRKPPELASLEELSLTPTGKPAVQGAEWEAVLKPFSPSVYAPLAYRLSIWFSPEYPLFPPHFRFRSAVFSHFHVLDTGELDEYFYHVLNWDGQKHLREALALVCSLFYGVLPVSGEASQFSKQISHQQQHIEEVVRHRISSIVRYQPIHSDLFQENPSWKRQWFDPLFYECLQQGDLQASLERLLKVEVPDKVYSFPMFSQNFCCTLLEELRSFEKSGLPRTRPNSMNNYGLILNDIGLERLFDSLLRNYLRPIAAARFSKFGGDTIDHHHTFMVQYMEGQDLSLDMHSDDSEVTFNVNLYDNFTGSGLAFCGLHAKKDARKHAMTYKHEVGRCVIHAGRLRHGALPIESGQRYNLIIWTRSCIFRNNHPTCPCCKKKKQAAARTPELTPDAVCLSRTHDPDYEHWAQLIRDETRPVKFVKSNTGHAMYE